MTSVLITRAEPDASEFAAECRLRGLDPVISPVMRIEIEKTEPDLSDVGALAFTSVNGVRAFAANSPERSLPVFAVGPVTAAAATAAGFQQIGVAGGDVHTLTNHIAAESALLGKAILHIAGADRAGDLVAMLGERSVAARRQTLYHAKAEDMLSAEAVAALKGEPGLWVTLFSPRTATLFLALAEKAGLTSQLAQARALCLSAAVAQAASAVIWGETVVASDLTAQGMLETITGGGPRA
ncbi:uroporphyrinogen-III synthase [Marinicaulis aureus]|uniref:Uroporphyrinogen-III synthase n=1 Tax=Hyphococcus aureus TaxID=2666033 RepID=A0ABW1KVZ9_9PROT